MEIKKVSGNKTVKRPPIVRIDKEECQNREYQRAFQNVSLLPFLSFLLEFVQS